MICPLKLSDLAAQLGGELVGADVEFSSLSTDTRTLQSGDVYLALTGLRFDGNDFVAAAEAAGAAAVIVSRTPDVGIPALVVPDTLIALGEIARANRRAGQARLIALTGSQGKTTVKEMMGAILSQRAPTLVTQGNLNNTIGVPLTLLGLERQHQYAVIEMGANGPGEIIFSAGIAEPDLSLITLASDAHLEGFGSLMGIVRAKGEILDPLSASGVALLNADDANVENWIERAGDRRVVLFGFDNGSGRAQYFAEDVQYGAGGKVRFTLHTPQGSVPVSPGLLGRHNVFNAVAAAAAALEAGAPIASVAPALASIEPVPGRMFPLTGLSGCCLVDDTYNASPSSFKAAIDVLTTFIERKIVVAGDMKELGAESDAAHESVGAYARQAGVDELWGVGPDSKLTVAAFGERGRHFDSQQALIEACKAKADANTAFLVKGSRGAQMEKVVAALRVDGAH